MRRVGLLGLVCVLACGARGSGEPAAAEGQGAVQPAAAEVSPQLTAAEGQAAAQPAAAAAVARPAPAIVPRLRLVRASAQAGLRSGSVRGVGEWFVTGPSADAEVELDASDTGRVRLGPDTQLWAFELGRASLLLVSGRARGQVLPDAPRPGRNLLRLATPLGTLRVPGTAEFWVAVRSDQVQLQLLQGEVELLRPEQKLVTLSSAQSSFGPLPLQVGVSRTDKEAQAALSKVPRRVRADPALPDADRRLEAQLQAYVQLRERGEQLLARVSPSHGQKLADAAVAAKPRSTEEIRAYQRDLADYARTKHEASELLLLAAERSLLATLQACPVLRAQLDCPAVQRWQERFAGLQSLILDR